MNDPKQFAERLKALMRAAKDGQSNGPPIAAALAKRHGVREPTVSQWLDGQFLPRADRARKMAADYGVNFEWLYFGTGPKEADDQHPSRVQEPAAVELWRIKPEDFPIPQFDVAGSMGEGACPPDHVDIVRNIAVSLAELRKKVHFTSPNNLSFITGYGPSMEPTFFDGDLLLIDEGVTTVEIDAVFVFLLNGKLYIKTLQRTPSGGLMMISDNKKFLPYEISESDSFIVRGRVLLAMNAKRL